MRRVIPALALCLWALAVTAESGEDADEAFSNGDYATALRLLRPLADQGYPQAQHNIAYLYYSGQGVPQDYAEAAKWYRKAAGQGFDSSQHNLCHLYYNGQGVPQDYGEAARWCREAALRGNVGAQVTLGLMYYEGEGVPQDYVTAHMWFNLAAAGATEKKARDAATQNRNLAASKMTPAQVAEAQKLAREWKPAKP